MGKAAKKRKAFRNKARAEEQAPRKWPRALLWLPLSMLVAALAVGVMARASAKAAPEWFAVAVQDIPAFMGSFEPGEDEPGTIAFAAIAWRSRWAILLTWPLIALAGLHGKKPLLGHLGAAFALAVYWVFAAGLVMASWFKALRFLKIEDIPESYAWLDPTGERGLPWREAFAIHTGLSSLWLSALFGAVFCWAVASFIRSRPRD